MPLVIGQNVGPYRITDQLGQGGMATVYRAYHANLDRYVAIKILHAALKSDPNFEARFRREAQIVARLEHPNIVSVYDYDQYEGEPYLVMKFIEGQTLKARMNKHDLSLAEITRIISSIGDALSFAHERDILHRDIKPSNILLDKEGQAYLADFGLARIATLGESTMSQDMMLGTPQYISPEQAQGIKDLTAATDVYSLGVVLYELVVGRVPFIADTPYAIIHSHIYAPLPLPSQLNPNVPPAVEQVLLKAMAKTPGDRFTSARGLAQAFTEAIASAGLQELTGGKYRVGLPTSDQTTNNAPNTPITPSRPAVAEPSSGGLGVNTPFPLRDQSGSSLANNTPTNTNSNSQASATLLERLANQQRRYAMWTFGGFALLLLTCLGALFVVVSTFADVNVRLRPPADLPSGEGPTGDIFVTMAGPFVLITMTPTPPSTVASATAVPTVIAVATEAATIAAPTAPASTAPAATPMPLDPFTSVDQLASLIGTLTIEEAQAYAASYPDDPRGHFALAIALSRISLTNPTSQAGAINAMRSALSLAGKEDPIVTISDLLGALIIYNETQATPITTAFTIVLMSHIYNNEQGLPISRSSVGEELYRIANENTSLATLALAEGADQTQNAYIYALYALTLAKTRSAPANVETALNKAIALDGQLQEVRLVQAVVLHVGGKTDEARRLLRELRIARPLRVPAWISKEADRLLEEIG
jgi:serine/threonine protein kinase